MTRLDEINKAIKEQIDVEMKQPAQEEIKGGKEIDQLEKFVKLMEMS
jgi:hypothetical protein